MKTASRFTLLILLTIAGFTLFSCKKESETLDPPKSSQKTITANPTVTGVTNATVAFDNATTYTITVPSGTNIKALQLTIAVSPNATISPDPTQARDYTNPVSYKVTAEDGSTQAYTVKVVALAAPKSTEKQIVSFTFASFTPPISATIGQSTYKISATVPSDANLSSLAPTIITSAKATISPSSGVSQNFTNPVSYTVTAEDGSTQAYEVAVTKQIMPIGKQCQVTRIEETSTGDYMTFEYDANGRIVKRIIKDIDFLYEITIEYNSNNEVTTWKSKRTTSPDGKVLLLEWRTHYTGTKLTSIEAFSNLISLKSQAITADDQNRITSWKYVDGASANSSIFSYLNGNMVKANYCENTTCTVSNLEYDTRKHFLAGSKTKGVWSFYNVTGYGGFTMSNIHSYSFVNNPTKITTYESGKLSHQRSYDYDYNQDGYPVAIRFKADYGLGTDSPFSETKLFKVTYNKCP